MFSMGALKGFLFHQLTVKLAYWASNIVVSHTVAFLASEKYINFVGKDSGFLFQITDPKMFQSWLYLKVFAVTSFLAVIAQHYFHEGVLLPRVINPVKPGDTQPPSDIKPGNPA